MASARPVSVSRWPAVDAVTGGLSALDIHSMESSVAHRLQARSKSSRHIVPLTLLTESGSGCPSCLHYVSVRNEAGRSRSAPADHGHCPDRHRTVPARMTHTMTASRRSCAKNGVCVLLAFQIIVVVATIRAQGDVVARPTSHIGRGEPKEVAVNSVSAVDQSCSPFASMRRDANSRYSRCSSAKGHRPLSWLEVAFDRPRLADRRCHFAVGW